MSIVSLSQDTIQLSKGKYAVVGNNGTTYFDTNTQFKDTIIYKNQAIPCLIVKIDEDGICYTTKTNTYNTSWNQKYIEDLFDDLNMAFIYKKDVTRYYLSNHPIHTKKSIIVSPACEILQKEVDEFTGKTTISYNANNSVYFTKIIYNNISRYYLIIFSEITIPASQYFENNKGVILLFKNGQKINKPTIKIDYKTIEYIDFGKYIRVTASAFVGLTENEFKLFIQSDIVKYRLYIYDGECSYNTDSIKCLINSK